MLIHIQEDGTIIVENTDDLEAEQITMSRDLFDEMLHEMNCWRRLQHELDGGN